MQIAKLGGGLIGGAILAAAALSGCASAGTAGHPAPHGNMAALKIVRTFDMAPTYPGTDFTTDAWVAYIAPLETASSAATDQTLSTDILQYHNDLLLNGSNAYTSQPLTTLQAYGEAVYHFNVFPGS